MFWKNRNDKSGNTSKQCGQGYLSSNLKTDYQAEKDLGRPRPQSPRLLTFPLPLQNSVLPAVLHNADKIQVQAEALTLPYPKTGHCSVNLSEWYSWKDLSRASAHHYHSVNKQMDCNNGFSPLKSNQAHALRNLSSQEDVPYLAGFPLSGLISHSCFLQHS